MTTNTEKEANCSESDLSGVVSSELLYRTFEERGTVAVGFKCYQCKSNNMFTGDDADYLKATGEENISKVECGVCKKESTLEHE